MRGLFQVVGRIAEEETIAIGTGIREIRRLNKKHGKSRWRKKKGLGTIRLVDGSLHRAELHWYEAHGIGRCEIKIKRLLD